MIAHKSIVNEWNVLNPDKQVEYVQSNWSAIHDYLITAFETGDVPDIFHYESSIITDFALRGNLANLNTLLSEEFKKDIHSVAWESVRMNDGSIIGAPFILESMIILYNKDHFDEAGIVPPTFDSPWNWEDLRNVAIKLTIDANKDGLPERYGAAIGLRNSSNILLNLGLGFGCKFFVKENEAYTVRVDSIEMEFLSTIKNMIYKDKSTSPFAVTQSGPSIIPSFFNNKFSMVVGIGTWARQQLVENAPPDFNWEVLAPIRGVSQKQGSNSQTLSIPAKSKHKKEAAQFIEFFLNRENMAKIAKGDWMAPARLSLLNDEDFRTTKYGWDICSRLVDHLEIGPWLKLPGFAEWKGRVANPLFQEFFSNRMEIEELKIRLEDESEYVLSRYKQ